MTDFDAAKAKAEEASTPETFSFIDRLVSRYYPTDEVEIYLDEAAAYRVAKLEQQAAVASDPDQVNLIHEQIKFQREKAKASRYIIHLEGISSEEYDAVVDAAAEEFPLQYRETRNPVTLKSERVVIENADREQYFRLHLWAKFIRKVVDAEGRVDENITPEWIERFSATAPIMALMKVHASVDLLRMTTDWMDHIQDEDFLAKS